MNNNFSIALAFIAGLALAWWIEGMRWDTDVAIQKQFLADHAITNISPKDWCKAQGINYATGRRYVKKSTAKDAQKTAQPAQKELRNVRSEAVVSSIDELIDDDGFTPMQAAFVIEYLKDKNASQANAGHLR